MSSPPNDPPPTDVDNGFFVARSDDGPRASRLDHDIPTPHRSRWRTSAPLLLSALLHVLTLLALIFGRSSLLTPPPVEEQTVPISVAQETLPSPSPPVKADPAKSEAQKENKAKTEPEKPVETKPSPVKPPEEKTGAAKTQAVKAPTQAPTRTEDKTTGKPGTSTATANPLSPLMKNAPPKPNLAPDKAAEKSHESGLANAQDVDRTNKSVDPATRTLSDIILRDVSKYWSPPPEMRGPNSEITLVIDVLPNGMFGPPFAADGPWNPGSALLGFDQLPANAPARPVLLNFYRSLREIQPIAVPPDLAFAKMRSVPIRFLLKDMP